MWILYAAGSSFFAGITAILAKCGIRKTDSNVATAIRTVVVLVFSWLIVWMTGAWKELPEIEGRTMIFLLLSGFATGASWLCYFKALQRGNVNQVVPIDKSSTVLTILLALFFLGEGISFAKALCVLAIGAGTLMMVGIRKEERERKRNEGSRKGWLFYYRALQEGPASVVVPIDKLSMLVTIGFSYFVFHERLTRKVVLGAGLITAGTVWLAFL